MSKQIPWHRVIVESILIVISILLAFGIQAGWEARGERERELAAIAGMEEDFLGYAVEIQRHIELSRSRQAGAELLLSAVGPGESAPNVDLEEAIDAVWHWEEITFQGGALESLVSGSGLSTISDPVLREALSDWSQEITTLQQLNDFVTTQVRRFIGYLSEQTAIRDFDPSVPDLPASAFGASLDPLLRDFRFENLTYFQFSAADVVLIRLQRLEQAASEVLNSIGALDPT